MTTTPEEPLSDDDMTTTAPADPAPPADADVDAADADADAADADADATDSDASDTTDEDAS
ncbi:MAG: hypothetical protein WKF79_04580 [Nocardioides sp.]